MADIQWDKIGFDAYRTKTLVLARWKDGKWSEIKEDDLPPTKATSPRRSSSNHNTKAFSLSIAISLYLLR